MTGPAPLTIGSGGAVLCLVKARMPAAAAAESFAPEARTLIDLAERFGARSLGLYKSGSPAQTAPEGEADARECTLILAFANRPVLDRFSQALESSAQSSSPLDVQALEPLQGLGAMASAEPRIPYHLVNYH